MTSSRRPAASAPDDVIQFREIVAIIRRNFFASVALVILGGALGVGAYTMAPRRYVSKAVLNIDDAYFQVPLVSDLVANSNDVMEYKAKRETILRAALSNDFLDKLGQQFHVFRYSMTSPYHELEREFFRKGIEYYDVGSGSYQISMSGRTGEVSHGLVDGVLNQMISTLIAERQDKLIRARTAIQSNLAALKEDMAGEEIAGVQNSMDIGPQSLQAAEEKLELLEQRFTSHHPSVVRQRAIVERLKAQAKDDTGDSHMAPEALGGSKRTLQDLYDDLLRKYNYVNIVIGMEKASTQYPYVSVLEQPDIPVNPVFPKKIVFGIAGMVLGMLLALLRVLYKELVRGTFTEPAAAAEMLEAPFLGTLPNWTLPQSVKALPAPDPKKSARAEDKE